MILCYSVKAGRVVGTFEGFRTTQTLLPTAIEFIETFCTQDVVEMQNIFLIHVHGPTSETFAT